VTPQCGHAFACPPIPAAGTESIPIQHCGDYIVGADVREFSNGLYDARCSMAAIVTTSPTSNSQDTVNAAFPVEHQFNFMGHRIDVGNHFRWLFVPV
jgi:hypothetical protein